MYQQLCINCGQVDESCISCPTCAGPITFKYDLASVAFDNSVRSMWRYRDLLPVEAEPVTLGEGGTMLLPSRLRPNLFVKDETRNPTGSIKDRAMSLAFTRAAGNHRTHSIVASTGSAGMAAAAYAARAGVLNVVLVPLGTSLERTVTMWMYGSKVFQIETSADVLFPLVAKAQEKGWVNVSTYRRANPYQSEASKTIAYEIVESLQGAPDFVIVPMGGGGTFAAIGRGFEDFVSMGIIDTIPSLIAVQHEEFNAVERAFHEGLHFLHELKRYQFDSTRPLLTENLKHDVPPDAEEALDILYRAGGMPCSVNDEETLRAQRDLANRDGVFGEPSAVVGLAALRKLENQGVIPPDSRVVIVVTGAGLREIQVAIRTHSPELPVITPEEFLEQIVTL